MYMVGAFFFNSFQRNLVIIMSFEQYQKEVRK